MKVHELIQELMRYPLEREVILSSDEEGNDYNSVRGVQSVLWNARWREVVHPDDNETGDPDNAVVLWP